MNGYLNKYKYSTIVFDLGNVLISFDPSRWVKNFNKIQQGLGDRMLHKFKEKHNLQMEYEKGKLSDQEFIDICLHWLGNGVTSAKFCEIFSDIFTLNRKVIDLLPELKKRYKLVLLSNTSNIHKTYAWGRYSFIKNFDKLILSHEVGALKPEEKIYKAVEDFTGEPANNHIFVDDILEYVTAAKNLGWDGIHFTDYDNLVKEFELRGILA